jgi:ectoine hydroxylase-related dioxygenase (phytanoyl-CoA dioxygenase family)
MYATEKLESDGFTIIRDALSAQTVSALLTQVDAVFHSDATRRRGGSYFGIRNLLNVVPAVRELADDPRIRAIVDPVAGAHAKAIRGIYFDKTPKANWKVAWHQDLTIAVREEKPVAGFAGWSRKAGIVHVQPPTSILEETLTLRIHLDDADESNGGLKLIPGSHRHGRLGPEDIQSLVEQTPTVTCSVPAGGVLAMRPLLLHASSTAERPGHRRVIHLEFSPLELPGGLEWNGS